MRTINRSTVMIGSLILAVFLGFAPKQTIEFYGPAAASMEKALKYPVKLEDSD